MFWDTLRPGCILHYSVQLVTVSLYDFKCTEKNENVTFSPIFYQFSRVIFELFQVKAIFASAFLLPLFLIIFCGCEIAYYQRVTKKKKE